MLVLEIDGLGLFGHSCVSLIKCRRDFGNSYFFARYFFDLIDGAGFDDCSIIGELYQGSGFLIAGNKIPKNPERI